MSINASVFMDDFIITKEYLLRFISQKQIFSLVFKDKSFSLSKKVCSPFREDNNPGCYFTKSSSGSYYFNDAGSLFSQESKSIDCIEAVRLFYNLNDYYDSLRYIYNLIINGEIDIQEEAIEENKPIVEYTTDIKVVRREFQVRDVVFWERFGISIDNLIKDKVYPVKKIYLTKNNECRIINVYDIAYAYTDFREGRKKIYFPDRNKGFKFLGSTLRSDIGGINNLVYSDDLLIISKSYKDYRVIKNEGFNCIWFMSETTTPTYEIIRALSLRFKYIIVFYDNDLIGIRESLRLKKMINVYFPTKASHFYIPEKYINEHIKDPSDMYELKGKDYISSFLKEHLTL